MKKIVLASNNKHKVSEIKAIFNDYEILKGYYLNVNRFKNNGSNVYFEEILEKIRDIRSSEKVFWRKILDIYATSVDYDAKDEKTREFFKTISYTIITAHTKR